MKPVIETSLPFLSYQDLDVSEIDVYDDAWGFTSQFSEVFRKLSLASPEPSESVMVRLMEKIESITGHS